VVRGDGERVVPERRRDNVGRRSRLDSEGRSRRGPIETIPPVIPATADIEYLAALRGGKASAVCPA
jgi:hypothetical protein